MNLPLPDSSVAPSQMISLGGYQEKELEIQRCCILVVKFTNILWGAFFHVSFYDRARLAHLQTLKRT